MLLSNHKKDTLITTKFRYFRVYHCITSRRIWLRAATGLHADWVFGKHSTAYRTRRSSGCLWQTLSDQEIIGKNPPPAETCHPLPRGWNIAKLKPFCFLFFSLLSFGIAASVSRRKNGWSLVSSQQTSHKNTANRKEHLLLCINIFAELVCGIAHTFRISSGS